MQVALRCPLVILSLPCPFQEAFGDLALFFYDQHGGEVIGVLWKPTSFQPQPFKVCWLGTAMYS